MASAKHHYLFWVAGVGGGAFLAYEFLYKPWAAAQAAAGAANPLASFLGTGATAFPPAAAMVSAPSQITPSNLNPGAAVGGDVGACMTKKVIWTQQQCATRLNALKAAFANAQAAVANLQSGAANPAAAGIPAAQAQLAAEQAALAGALDSYNKLTAAGDTNGAATFHAAVLAHQADITDLQNRIAAAQAPVDNSAAIAAYEGQMAANDTDYFNLTGVHLSAAA